MPERVFVVKDRIERTFEERVFHHPERIRVVRSKHLFDPHLPPRCGARLGRHDDTASGAT